MPNRKIFALLPALLLLLGAAAAPAQGKEEEKEKPPRRIALIGASLSKGFSLRLFTLFKQDPRAYIEKRLGRKTSDREYRLRTDTARPAAILRKAWGGEAVVEVFADLNMFRRPDRIGQRQVKRAIRFAPDLVLGMDFLFWFGYGWAPADPEKEKAARLEMPQRGLQLLEELLAKTEATLILGNYPRLDLAGSFIISKSQIPSAGAIEELNAVLHAWAARRKRVHIWPLSGLVGEMYEKGMTRGTGKEQVRHRARDLLQVDRLHPTRLGTALAMHRLSTWWEERRTGRPGILPPGTELAELAELAGAELHLAAPLAPLPPKKGRPEPADKR